mgnify:CR=1 FL=1
MISNFTQVILVGTVSDNFDVHIKYKIFHAEIVVNNAPVLTEAKVNKKISEILNFTDVDGNETLKAEIYNNYTQKKQDIIRVVQNELERIAA